MQNKNLIVGQKLLLPSGVNFLVQNKNKKQITFVNLQTGEIHTQGLDIYFFGEIKKNSKKTQKKY